MNGTCIESKSPIPLQILQLGDLPMNWIRKNAKVILVVVWSACLVLLGLFLNKRGNKIIEVPSPPDIQNELRAIKAESEAAKAVAKLGAVEAASKVEAEHAATLQKLDDQEKAQATELKKDPAKLAAYLVRIGHKR